MANRLMSPCHYVSKILPFAACLILVAAGCGKGGQRGPLACLITWQDVKDWNEFSGILAQPEKIDEVRIEVPDRVITLRDEDARAVRESLSENATTPMVEIAPRKILGKLVFRQECADFAETTCFTDNVVQFKVAYIRLKHDVISSHLTKRKTGG